jgi:hypothetical protein
LLSRGDCRDSILDKRSVTDIPTGIITTATYLILWKRKRISESFLFYLFAVLDPFLKGVVNLNLGANHAIRF